MCLSLSISLSHLYALTFKIRTAIIQKRHRVGYILLAPSNNGERATQHKLRFELGDTKGFPCCVFENVASIRTGHPKLTYKDYFNAWYWISLEIYHPVFYWLIILIFVPSTGASIRNNMLQVAVHVKYFASAICTTSDKLIVFFFIIPMYVQKHPTIELHTPIFRL